MITKYSVQIKCSIVVLATLMPACNCLPCLANQPAAKSAAATSRKPAASAPVPAPTAESQFTPAQKAALLAKRRKWMLAQRSESGGTGEGAWHLMKKPYDLPNLPPYSGTGAEFLEGLVYPNKPGGAAISMTYRAKEEPDTVIGWYEDALSNYQWKILKTKEDGVLSATNGNNGVTVKVKPALAAKGFKTELKITFKLAHK